MVRSKNKGNKTEEQRESTPKGEEIKEKIEVVIGFDISTTTTGVTILDTSGKIILMDHIKLNTTKSKTIWKKADLVEQYLLDLKKKMPQNVFKQVFVEASAMRFTPGFSSAATLFTLNKFNGIVSYIARKIFLVDPVEINVNSARKALGIKTKRKEEDPRPTKEKVREAALLLFPEIPVKTHIAKVGKKKGLLVPDKTFEDELDAFILTRAAQILINNK